MNLSDAKDSQNTMPRAGAHSDQKQITPVLLRGLVHGHINDSDDSDSPLSDTPDTLDLEENFSFKLNSQPTRTTKDELQKELLREDIITTALDCPPKLRRQRMSDCFDKNGRLYKMYMTYNEDIRKAREARKQAISQQQQSDVKSRPKKPNSNVADKHSELQDEQRAKTTLQPLLSNRRSQEHVQKRQRMEEPESVGPSNKRKPFKDTGGICCQPCREKEQLCERFLDTVIGMTCLSCYHAGETCSLSTGRKLRDPKAGIHSKAKVHSEPQLHSKTQSHSKIEIHLRTDSHSSSHGQSRKTTAYEPASRGASKTRRLPQISKPNSSSRAVNDTRAALHSSDEPENTKVGTNTTALPSGPSNTIKVAVAAQQRERVAAQNIRETLQRQLMRGTTICDICLNSPCSCHPSQISREDILCNGESCSRSWFSNDYLEKYLGIQLSDAQDFRRKYGFWSCPECSYKKAAQDSHGPNVFASTYPLPKYSSTYLEAEDVSRSLNEFWGLTGQYIHMANKNAAPPSMRMQPLLQIPCIREEASNEQYSPLIYVLRRILKVDPGILVKDMVLNSQLQNLECSAWMRAVLVFLFFEFVFKTPSPFDDVAIWRKGLVHSFKPELVEMWIQDNHIRNMHERTGSYQARRKDQHDQHIRQLNAAMMPLIGGIGGNEVLHRIHVTIADIAGDLNAKFIAYTGTPEPIMPGTGDIFDPEIHISDDPLDEYRDLSHRHVMLTTMGGVRFHVPGQPVRTWSKAKVRLRPKSDGISGTSNASLSSVSGSSHGQAMPRKRSYHDLISPETD